MPRLHQPHPPIMLAPLLAHAVFGAHPQCPVSGLLPCAQRLGDGEFSLYISPGRLGAGAPFLMSGAPADAMCNKTNWEGLNHCGWNSNLRLTITEPEEFRSHVVLHGTVPIPWVDSFVIDQRHPSHGKVVEVVGPEDGKDPCLASSWGSFDRLIGSIVTYRFPRTCSIGYPLSVVSAKWHGMDPTSGPPRPLAMIIAKGEEESLYAHHFDSGGSFAHMPVHMSGGALSYMAQEAQAAGKKLMAKVELVCPTGNEPPAPPPEFIDSCPDDRLRGLCPNMPDPEDRLCSKCPLQLKVGEGKACAYGSRLYPSRKVHFFQGVREVPSSVNAVYLEPPPWGGCDAMDFAGASGKVVVFPYRYCMQDAAGVLNAARLAEQNGATGVIFLSHRKSFFMLSGPGILHSIPVHTVSADEVHVVTQWFTTAGGPGSTLTLELVDEDAAPEPVLLPTPAPAPLRTVVDADTAALMAKPGAVACVVLTVLLLAGIVAKLVVGSSAGRNEDVSGVPLSVASTLLSVSLLVVVTVIAYSLSAAAARAATNAAAVQGQSATRQTYDNAVVNVDRLSGQLLKQVLGDVTDSLGRSMVSTESMMSGLQELFDVWDGSWVGFMEMASAFYRQTPYRTGFESALGSKPHTGVQTTQGFYFDTKWMTDFSSTYINNQLTLLNSAYFPNTSRHITGLRQTSFDRVTFLADPSGLGLKQMNETTGWRQDTMNDSPLKRIGGEIVDPVHEAQRLGLRPHQHVWRIASEGIPFAPGSEAPWKMPIVAVSSVMPLFDNAKTFRGAVVSAMDVTDLYKILVAVKNREKAFANMTILVYDADTEALVASTNHASVDAIANVVDYFSDYRSTPTPHFKALSVAESKEAADNAFYHYMQERPVPALGVLTGEFDQRDYYSHPDLHELNLVATSAGMADGSPHAVDVDPYMDGCDRCVVEDATYGHAVRFHGKNKLHVKLELTTDVPYVAAKRKGSGLDPWASDDPVYAHAKPIPGSRGRQCIYKRYRSLYIDRVSPCSLRSQIGFVNEPQYTLSIRIKPDADVLATDRDQMLFRHREVGASSLTVYASGSIVVGSQMGGCSVNGPGVPGGVWTIVTVRHDMVRKLCEVYLNGTRLVTQRSSYTNAAPFLTVEPFVIGSGFKGLLQSVRLFKFFADAESLTDAVYTRNVPSRKWLFELGWYQRLQLVGTQAHARKEWRAHNGRAPTKRESSDYKRQTNNNNNNNNNNKQAHKQQQAVALGLNWLVSVRIPRDDVMRDVDENNRYLAQNLRQQEANTEAQLDRDLAETILVTAVVVLVSVVVFLVFNDMLTGPFAEVSSVMCDAAMMRADDVPERQWGIAELNLMQAAMRLMVRNLKEFRAFIPAALMERRQTNEDGHDESEVAIVFTDIRSSTSLWSRFPDAMAAGLRLHHEIIRSEIEFLDGYEVKTIGDSFMVAFSSVDSAVAFGLHIQQDLFKANWPAALLEHEAAERSADGAWNGINIRVGVHCGVAEVIEEHGRVDYCGTVVNTAARVEAQCVPGAVCVTDAVLQTLCMEEVENPVVVPLGHCDLKGLDNGVALHVLVPQGMPARAAAVEQIAARRRGEKERPEPSPTQHERQMSFESLVATSSSSSSSTGCMNPTRGASFILRQALVARRFTVAWTAFSFPGESVRDLPDPAEVQAVAAALLAAAGATQATVHIILGSAALLSWQQPGPLRSVRNAFLYAGGLAAPRCVVRTGVVTGRLLVGIVGTTAQRFTTCIGPAFPLAEELCGACARLPVDALFASVSDDHAVKHMRGKKDIRPIDTWEAGASEPLGVYQIRAATDVLRAASSTNPLTGGAREHAEVEDGADAGADGDWGDAYWNAFEGRSLDAFASDDPVVDAVSQMQRSGQSLRAGGRVPPTTTPRLSLQSCSQ